MDPDGIRTMVSMMFCVMGSGLGAKAPRCVETNPLPHGASDVQELKSLLDQSGASNRLTNWFYFYTARGMYTYMSMIFNLE